MRSHRTALPNLHQAIVLITFLLGGIFQAQIPTARQDVMEAERARPSDPWPRGRGHAVLAIPGSVESSKAYHEPGGSFSPEFDSFGVSLWITDGQGKVLKTSDSIPLENIRQSFVWHDGAKTPSIRTATDDYVAEWSLGSAMGTSQLKLDTKLPRTQKMMLAIRSVGPAGAALESLHWFGNALVINGRYRLNVTPDPVSVYVGPEGPSDWTTSSASPSDECHDRKGWCYARLELPSDVGVSVRVVDLFPQETPQLVANGTHSTLDIQVPDPRFAESLNAQVAHIMMSLVDNQTRPGEPNQYPLTWLRDGSFQVVGLARAGVLDTARELARYFAEHDFFGGFGAEGDNPGLALWVMNEVSSRLRNSDYDQYLWPHVYRKAEFILGMQATQQPVERIFAGSLVPQHRAEPDVYQLALPTHDGLVVGRMDLHYPVLYATAMSYNGLLAAAEVADRLNYGEDARRWRTAATQLRQAWNSAYKPEDPEADPRTFISGFWPTWVAADAKRYKEGLDTMWTAKWDSATNGFREIPLWTYFSFSMAHQYLLLGKSELPWQTLTWFWNHQPSPGLYSWWEGNGEENAFHGWDYVRGWVKPPYVTPHYWSAAECLLLQIDMLAFVDQASSEPTLVLGEGIPNGWVKQPMHVHGLLTKLGRVNWDWDGKTMVIKRDGGQIPVRLGHAFPKGAKIKQIPLTPS